MYVVILHLVLSGLSNIIYNDINTAPTYPPNGFRTSIVINNIVFTRRRPRSRYIKLKDVLILIFSIYTYCKWDLFCGRFINYGWYYICKSINK